MSKTRRPSKHGEAHRGRLLLRVIEKNDLAAVKSLIANQVRVNQPVDGLLPLNDAVARSRAKLVSLLIQAGADPNKRDAAGESSLFSVRELKIAMLLAAVGGNPNVVSAFGLTPLMVAAMNGQRKAVDALLRIGAKCDCRNAKGETALLLAADNARTVVVKHLLDHGADPHIRDADGNTALHRVAANSSRSACQIIRHLVASGLHVDVVQKKGETALMVAAYARAADVVDTLLRLGADPNHTSKNGLTPLLYATLREDRIGVQRLLEAGASVAVRVPKNFRNRSIRGMTPEALALSARNFKLANLLRSREG